MAMLQTGGGLRGGLKVKESQGSCQSLSKVVVLGGKYRLFFPIFHTGNVVDVVTATMAGRKLDREILKKSFVPITNFEQSATGKINDKTGLDSYARIARVIHKSNEKAEKEAAEREAAIDAEKLGVPVDQAALKLKLKEIETKYNGDNSDKNNPVYATKNPIIGSMVIEIATECLVVPLGQGDVPQWDKSQVASVALSTTKSEQLLALLDDANYANVHDDFLEVSYVYSGKDKASAGRAASFQGIAASLSLKAIATDSWEKEGLAALKRVSRDADAIASKNFNMSSSVTPEEIMTSFKNYCSKTPAIFANMDYEADETKWAAKDMLERGVVPEQYAAVREKLEALVSEQGDEAGEVDNAETMSAAMEVQSGIEALRDVAAAIPNIDKVTDGGAGELEAL